MAKRKFIDFDRFWQETQPKEDELPRVRVFGEDIVLPASLPAVIVLQYIRAGADADERVGAETMVKIAESLFGADRLQRWLDNGLTQQQLIDLVTETVRLYRDVDDDEAAADEEGNP